LSPLKRHNIVINRFVPRERNGEATTTTANAATTVTTTVLGVRS
jgi:hypothetical protein